MGWLSLLGQDIGLAAGLLACLAGLVLALGLAAEYIWSLDQGQPDKNPRPLSARFQLFALVLVIIFAVGLLVFFLLA